MKIMQINDPHISDQPPRMRTASYREDVLDKLQAALALASELEGEVDVVVVTGDLFHRKTPSHTSHRTVQAVRAIFDKFDSFDGTPVFIIPGNHDQSRSGDIAGQPVASVSGNNIYVAGMFTPLPGVAMIPWSNAMEGPDGIDYIVDAIKEAGAPEVVLAHAPVTLEPYPFGPEKRGWIDAHELAKALPSSVKLFAHGHMHKGHPPTMIDGVMFSNPGALARATIGADDRDRVPQVAILEVHDQRIGGAFDHVTVEYIEVPHRPAAEVYRVAVADAQDERATGIAALSTALAAADTHVVTRETLVESTLKLERPDDVPAADWSAGIDEAIAALEDA